MAFKKRTFSVTTDGSGDGTDEIGLGAAYGRIHEFVVDDSASTEAAVVFTISDDRSRTVFVSDALDVSEGPFYKHPTQDSSDDSDDNEDTEASTVVKGPVTITVASGGASLTYTGSLIVEV